MKLLIALLVCLPVAVVCVMFAGCEAEPANQAEITITPASVTLANGQSVEFTATGWKDYKWWLENPLLGTLSRTKGDSTVYTSRTTNNVRSLIYAESLVSIDTGRTNSISGTNNSVNIPTHLSGQAEIVHE